MVEGCGGRGCGFRVMVKAGVGGGVSGFGDAA